MNNSLNLQEINQEQAFSLAKFFIRSNNNLFLIGQRGVGKSQIILDAIKDCGYKSNMINLSVMERFDLAGMPDLSKPGDTIHFKFPHYLPRLKENQKPNTVLFFDEVDKCSPEITAPLLEILQFRTINGVPLNAVACVMTANLSNEHSYSNPISSALLDRTSKYILNFDFDLWFEWAKNNQIHDLILGFLKNYPELACGKADDLSYASPSPRSWTLASEAIIKAKVQKIVDIETITSILAGFVGNQASLKFKIWYQNYRKFEPIVINLIEKRNLIYDYTSLIPTEKLIFVIAACYLAKQKTLENIKNKNRFVYIENLCYFFVKYKIDYELQVVGLNNSFDFNFITKYKLYENKEFFDLFTKLNKEI